jgi:hypothetical protein
MSKPSLPVLIGQRVTLRRPREEDFRARLRLGSRHIKNRASSDDPMDTRALFIAVGGGVGLAVGLALEAYLWPRSREYKGKIVSIASISAGVLLGLILAEVFRVGGGR